MDISIGLPATIPGTSGERVLAWARQADAGPFKSLGIIDRLVYSNHEPLIALAAAAGATQRIRLMTTLLLGPLRDAAVLAKQAATLDALSGGRFTLGLGVGGREDDYRAVAVPMHERGQRFDEQLALLKRVWAGEPVGDGIGPIGPPSARPGGPEVLIGGGAPAALRRAGRWGDGYIAAPMGPDQVAGAYATVEASWREAGRSGRPRLVGGMYYVLGPESTERGRDYLRDYYGFLGPMAEQIAASIPTTPEAVKGITAAYAGIGMDELVFWPCVADLNQIDRLADLTG
jgi:alkanesulfonate monooxygenase SsuD/methylene tetrahydromethanopterin reductase-like flavin-dependent oxidoreductase (luciferase family)